MSAYQPVLDPACGGRMFWFDKSDSRVLFGDVRDESWELCDGRRFEVKPDMLMDYTDLPCTTPRQEAIWMEYNGITRGD